MCGVERGCPRHTAIVLTWTAYASNECLNRVDKAMRDSTALERTAGWARRLYAHIAAHVGRDVDVTEIESEFGFQWVPVAVDSVRMGDPYSSRALDDCIKKSFAGLLSDLNRVCSTLPGLNPGEALVEQDVVYASNVMWDSIGRALCNPTCTQQGLQQIANSVYAELVDTMHRRALDRLSAQVKGVKALQRLCAAATEGRDLGTCLEQDMEHIGIATNMPPPSLMHELTRMGVPLVALRDILFPRNVTAPMSGRERQANVEWWVRMYGPMVDAAALVALPDLNLLITQPATWRGWDGLGVWLSDSEQVRTAQQTDGIRATAAVPNAAHTHAMQSYAIVATASSRSTAIRAIRLARVVLELVCVGALRPRRIKADGLLAFIQRFEVATSFQRDRILDDMDGMECNADQQDQQDRTDRSDRTTSRPLAPTVQPTASGKGLIPTMMIANGIPKSLLRDYIIVLLVRDRLSACPSNVTPFYVGVSTISTQLRNLPDLGEATVLFRNRPTASLSITVAHVFKKVAGLLKDKVDTNDVGYGPTPAWVPGCTGLILSKSGRRLLATYLDELMADMQPPGGAEFAKVWHHSPSARSRARRRA